LDLDGIHYDCRGYKILTSVLRRHQFETPATHRRAAHQLRMPRVAARRVILSQHRDIGRNSDGSGVLTKNLFEE
jgi:hypothetical protein